MYRYFILLLCIPISLAASSKRLSEKPLSISIVYDSCSLRLPGSVLEIGVEALMPYSTILRTKNIGGDLGMGNFNIEVQNGKVLFSKIHFLKDQFAHPYLTVSCKKYPEVRLATKLHVHRESVIYPKVIALGDAAPGEKFALEVNAMVLNDLQENHLVSMPLELYDIYVVGGNYKNGRIHISDDPRDLIQHSSELIIRSVSGAPTPPNFHIAMDYVKRYKFRRSGFSGFAGSSGFSGSSGQNGQHGNHGEHGDIGPPIDVYVNGYFDSLLQTCLLDVEVYSLGKEEFFRINPDGGSLQIASIGGDGGNGGDGGDGGNGRDGADAEVVIKKVATSDSTWREVRIPKRGENGGDGGHGGDGGWAGDGGPGGKITIYFNEFAEPYLNIIQAFSIGGDGGRGGDPGTGGRGGDGGDGEPDGKDGQDGFHGIPGQHGYDGESGEVMFVRIDQQNSPR